MPKTLLAACFLLCSATFPARADEASRQPVTIRFDTLITRHIVVQIKINGKGPYRVIFDTGSPMNLINSRTAKASGLIGKDSPGTFSLFGPPPTSNIKNLQIGDLKAENVPVLVMDHPTVEAVARILGPVEGIIGFPFFARYKLTLDYQAKEMALVPTNFEPSDVLQTLVATLLSGEKQEKKILAPAGLWGMIVEKKDDEPGIVIKEVLAKSAADSAGVKAGDRLLTLDDRWTDSLADCYAAAEHAKPGVATTILVKREGKEIGLTVTPDSGL